MAVSGAGGAAQGPMGEKGEIDGGMPDACGGGACADGANETGPEPERPLRQAKGCPASERVGRALFEIPRAGEVTDDFFRLPFPNDVRRPDGQLDLSELPAPAVAVAPFDLINRYVTAMREESTGFGLSPVVFFRFSRQPALAAGAGVHGEGAVVFVDVTPGSPERGQVIPHRVRLVPAWRYVCASALAVEPRGRRPLLPGHSYAVWFTDAVTDEDGQRFTADVDLPLVLGARRPSGAERAAAWAAYAPLRSFLADRKVDPRRLLSATVFTTQRVDAPAALRAAVLAAPVPRVTELVACGETPATRRSSCDDSRTVACADVEADQRFVEYRGRLSIPVFQAGTPPYEQSGGLIGFDAQGRARIVRDEAICFTLTVPRGTPPAAGWPVVVYSHGTGADHRWHVNAGLAGELAEGALDERLAVDARLPMATVGYDGVLHGSRKGRSIRSTEDLVYNVANPAAARDNGLQAAADLFAIAHALPTLAVGVAPLDAGRVGLYGHSQGGNAAAVAAGYEPSFGVVVLSGTGGGLTRSMLTRTTPVNVGALLPVLLGETTPVDAGHPVLSLLQMYFDRADPLNHAPRIVVAPPVGSTARHLLHVFGAQDSYAPDVTQRDFGVAAGLAIVHPLTSEPAGPVVLAPVHANTATAPGSAGLPVTAVQAQYLPDRYDGHFVSTHNPRARRAIQRMLGSYFRDGIPTVE